MIEIAVPAPDDLLLNSLRLRAPGQVNRSGWTGTRKVVGLPGVELWLGAASLADIATEEEERPWRAFLFGLSGQANWFKWPLPCNQHPGGKPRVAAGAGSGYTLPLKQMQPNTTILQAGQFMTIPLPSLHNRAVCLTADLVADGNGNGTAQFGPALGEIPAESAIVESLTPFVPMSLTTSEEGFDLSNGVSGTAFDVEEAR